LKVNGKDYALKLDPRTTLLDCLREHLHLTGSKKGCDHGQCGACTVHINGRCVPTTPCRFPLRLRIRFGFGRNLAARRSCRAITTSVGSSVIGDDVVVPWEANGFPYSPFVQEIHPPIRLLVFGEGPDSAPLRQLCELLGWQAIDVVDANAFSIEPDEWTAAIVKSHNYGRDFTALQKLLPLNLRYVGLISPRKRRDQLLNDLLDVGVAINAGFFAPAGLALGMETPQEIALSIVAEIQRVFAGGSGESLRERKSSIHALEQSVVPNEWQTSAR